MEKVPSEVFLFINGGPYDYSIIPMPILWRSLDTKGERFCYYLPTLSDLGGSAGRIAAGFRGCTVDDSSV